MDNEALFHDVAKTYVRKNEDYRTETFRRDSWKCRHCGWRNGIHAHHMVYRSHGGQDTKENVITLCCICHEAVHAGNLILTWGNEGANGEVVFKRLNNWRPQ